MSFPGDSSMPSEKILQIVNNVRDLVSLPEIALRVNEMASDPNVTTEEMGKVIAQDPALATRLLKIANSAYYGLSREVESVERAIAILGVKKIRDLVLSTTSRDTFEGIPNDIITMHDFWHHSLYCGLLTQILAKKSDVINSDSMFIAGLLHDIGQLVMFNQFPEESKEALVLLAEGTEQMEITDTEDQVFGFNHSELGAELMRHWNFPELFTEITAHHHNPKNASSHHHEVALIHIANAVAVFTNFDLDEIMENIPRIHPLAWEMAGICENDLPMAMKMAQEEISEIEAVLFPLNQAV